MNGFFITGTDTEIGKTFTAAALTHMLVFALTHDWIWPELATRPWKAPLRDRMRRIMASCSGVTGSVISWPSPLNTPPVNSSAITCSH